MSGKLRSVIPFVFLILAAALPSHSQISPGKTFDLHVGESVIIGGYLHVGFDGVPTDNRCPEGVYCLWEGDAVAKIWADHPLKKRTNVDLHTYHGFQREFDYGDYRITLTGIAPYPKIDDRPDPEEYVATLYVIDVSTPVELTTWGRIKAFYKE